MNFAMCLLTSSGCSWWGAGPAPFTICIANLIMGICHSHEFVFVSNICQALGLPHWQCALQTWPMVSDLVVMSTMVMMLERVMMLMMVIVVERIMMLEIMIMLEIWSPRLWSYWRSWWISWSWWQQCWRWWQYSPLQVFCWLSDQLHSSFRISINEKYLVFSGQGKKTF